MVGFWVVVVKVVAVFHFQHCLDCCHAHLHCQSCRIHLRWWCWHVELAMNVEGPILLVILEVELQRQNQQYTKNKHKHILLLSSHSNSVEQDCILIQSYYHLKW